MVRLRVVLQRHPVELALVDVGHLVVLSPHGTARGGVQHRAEPIGGVELGDLDLLCVTEEIKISSKHLLSLLLSPVAPGIVMPRFTRDCVVIQDVLSVVEARVTVHYSSRCYLQLER